MIISGKIEVAEKDNISFLFRVEQVSFLPVPLPHIPSSSQGHFDDFDALAIVNSALLNAGVPVSFGMKSFLQLYSKLRNT